MNAIAAMPTHGPSATVQPRLVQAAHEFEAQLMKELLKPMAAGATMDGGESDAGSGGVMADFATEASGAIPQQAGRVRDCHQHTSCAFPERKKFSRFSSSGKRNEYFFAENGCGAQVKLRIADKPAKEDCVWKSEIMPKL